MSNEQQQLNKICEQIFYDENKSQMFWNELIRNKSENFFDAYNFVKNYNISKINTFHVSIFSIALISEQFSICDFLIDNEKFFITQASLESFVYRIALNSDLTPLEYLSKKLNFNFNSPEYSSLRDLNKIQKLFWKDYLSYNFNTYNPPEFEKNLNKLEQANKLVPFYIHNFDNSKDKHYYQLKYLIDNREKFFSNFNKKIPLNMQINFLNYLIPILLQYDSHCFNEEFKQYPFLEIIHKKIQNDNIAKKLSQSNKTKINKL